MEDQKNKQHEPSHNEDNMGKEEKVVTNSESIDQNKKIQEMIYSEDEEVENSSEKNTEELLEKESSLEIPEEKFPESTENFHEPDFPGTKADEESTSTLENNPAIEAKEEKELEEVREEAAVGNKEALSENENLVEEAKEDIQEENTAELEAEDEESTQDASEENPENQEKALEALDNMMEKFLSEEEKKWAYITENGSVMLKNTDEYDERKIEELVEGKEEEILNKLREQYTKAKEEIEGLRSRYEVDGDQIKLYPEVQRLMKDMAKIKALGNLPMLIVSLKDMDKTIGEQIRQGVARRKQILDQYRELLTQPIDNVKTRDLETKQLLENWKEVKGLPKEKNSDLQSALRELQDEYTLKRREKLRQLDFEYLNNLDRKREIISKAQAVLDEGKWKSGHNQMQQLFEEWKSVGPVPRDQMDKVWEEFKTIKDTFYKNKNVHFDELFSELESNYSNKLSIVEKIEALKDSSKWSKTTKEILDLDKEFDKHGRVPTEKKQELLDRLHAAKNVFFDRKKEAMDGQKEEFEKNLEKKESIADKVEKMQDSTDWRNTTREMNRLFDDWKNAGPTFRSKEQKVWNRFIKARKNFFNRKDEHFAELDKKKFKDNILKVDSEKEALKRLEARLKEDEETLANLQKDYDSESNDRFKSKIKETIDLMEKNQVTSKKEIEQKQKWIKDTEAMIEKMEKEEKAKEKEAKKEEKAKEKIEGEKESKEEASKKQNDEEE